MKGLRGQGKNGREKCAPSEIRVTTLLLCNFEIGSVVKIFFIISHINYNKLQSTLSFKGFSSYAIEMSDKMESRIWNMVVQKLCFYGQLIK